MLAAFANLRLAVKLAIPLTILALVTVLIVFIARDALQRQSAVTREIVEVKAERRAQGLQIANAISNAVVAEKNLILATDPADMANHKQLYDDRVTAARNGVQWLLDRSDSPERKTANEKLREALATYLSSADQSVAASMHNNQDDARKISLGPSRALRAPLTKLIDERVEANARDMIVAQQNAAQAQADTARDLIIAAAIGLLFGFGGIALVVIYLVVRPLTAMTGTMQALAGGDLAVDVVGADRRDEVGALARSLQVFKDNAIEARRLAAEQEAMKTHAAAEQKAALHRMADKFENSVGGIVSMVASAASQMQGSAQSLASTADAANQQAAAVATATTETSANVQTVATAAEELAATTSEIARQVAHSSSIANRAREEADATGVAVEALTSAAQRIGEVVTLIQDIASQTNLLALNATIEAARAGEMGKGFAVVASEVKLLAGQTAKATEDIGAQIDAIQSATNGTVGAIQRIGTTISELNEVSAAIAAAVEEQSVATREIATNVQQAARGTEDVAANIVGVTESSNEVGSAASQVLGSAGALTQQSQRLAAEVDEFLRGVRVAA